MNNNIIANIEPYNELFYTCLTSSIIPVIKHFKCDEKHYWLNEIFFYKYEDSQDAIELSIDSDSVKTFEQLNYEHGITTQTKVTCENIVEEIIESISNNRTAIAWIDSFYESIRSDTYKKIHLEHSLLFFGFDKSQKIFNIIEQSHYENVIYEKKTISFLDVQNAFEGRMKNFYQDGKPVFYSFGKEDKVNSELITKSSDYYIDYYSNNIKLKEEKITKGLEDLKKFINDFEKKSENSTQLLSGIDKLINNLNSIILTKQVEKYKATLLFGEASKQVMLQEDIVKCWNQIRAVLAKILYSSMVNKKSLQQVMNKFELIIELEEEYYGELK